ncbi:MAG: hypothetical protein HKM93_15660 [Desulfobacteraceae bacterium]|nr:hypothetical protein [Desulfobacteraceae bacterium]
MFEHPITLEYDMKYRQEELHKAAGNYTLVGIGRGINTKRRFNPVVALADFMVSIGLWLKKRYEPLKDTGPCCSGVGCSQSC